MVRKRADVLYEIISSRTLTICCNTLASDKHGDLQLAVGKRCGCAICIGNTRKYSGHDCALDD